MTDTRQDRRARRRAALKVMKRRVQNGDVAPQTCTSCRADLTDTTVPPDYRQFRLLFTLAVERQTTDGGYCWQCPFCQFAWGRRARKW